MSWFRVPGGRVAHWEGLVHREPMYEPTSERTSWRHEASCGHLDVYRAPGSRHADAIEYLTPEEVRAGRLDARWRTSPAGPPFRPCRNCLRIVRRWALVE